MGFNVKGRINSGHIPDSDFALVPTFPPFPGGSPITIVDMSGIDVKLQNSDMPDTTWASGGRTMPVEFTLSIPEHHVVEILYMEDWFKAAKAPVRADYKRDATLIAVPITGMTGAGFVRTYGFKGLGIVGRKTAERKMEGEGKMTVVEYSMKADDFFPIT